MFLFHCFIYFIEKNDSLPLRIEIQARGEQASLKYFSTLLLTQVCRNHYRWHISTLDLMATWNRGDNHRLNWNNHQEWDEGRDDPEPLFVRNKQSTHTSPNEQPFNNGDLFVEERQNEAPPHNNLNVGDLNGLLDLLLRR